MRKSDREQATTERGSSKALSARVTTSAGLEPHPITKYVWRTSLVATVVTLLAAGAYLGLGGDKRAFQTRRVSSPHGFVEHRCELCHDTWAPAERIVGTFTGEPAHSVSNEKCEDCHRGALHHVNQFPRHYPTEESSDFLSCAKCHREHRGNVDLAFTASRHCTDCHAHLDEHALENVPGHAFPPPFALEIHDFEVDGGHPEFALMRLLAGEPVSGLPRFDKEDEDATFVAKRIEPPAVLAPFVTPEGKPPNEPAAAHDPGRLRFNHFAHLRRPLPVRDDEENAARWGDRTKCYAIGEDSFEEKPCEQTDQQMVELQCADCHVPDTDGRYMLSIDYTQHCRICHRIPFDIERFPDETVPHAAIAAAARERRAEGLNVLRGYLSEKFAQDTLSRRTEATAPELDPLLLVPGRPTRTLLTAAERRQVRRETDAAGENLMRSLTEEDVSILRGAVNTLGESARGGCRFCHEVEKVPEQLVAVQGEYAIRPTGIPDRWMPHSRFDHASHREMECGDCHYNERAAEGFRSVEMSAATADVLMPSIAVCRECHSRNPTHPEVGSARSDCVECHRYHDHSLDPFDTGPNPVLGSMDKGRP